MDDLTDRKRFINVKNTLSTLMEWNVIPIINENDTVAVDEIKFGDNDHLAAVVANITEADLVISMTNTDGLYDRNPKVPGVKKAKLIGLVREITDNIESMATVEADPTGNDLAVALKSPPCTPPRTPRSPSSPSRPSRRSCRGSRSACNGHREVAVARAHRHDPPVWLERHPLGPVGETEGSDHHPARPEALVQGSRNSSYWPRQNRDEEARHRSGSGCSERPVPVNSLARTEAAGGLCPGPTSSAPESSETRCPNPYRPLRRCDPRGRCPQG
jgi:hypothetical protein